MTSVRVLIGWTVEHVTEASEVVAYSPAVHGVGGGGWGSVVGAEELRLQVLEGHHLLVSQRRLRLRSRLFSQF